MTPVRLTFDPPLDAMTGERVMDALYAVLGGQASATEQDAETGQMPRVREVSLELENPSVALMALHGALVDEGLDKMRLLVLLHMGNDAPIALLTPPEHDHPANMARPR
jgi:hypothetical protein